MEGGEKAIGARGPGEGPPRPALSRRALWVGALAALALGFYIAVELGGRPDRGLVRLSQQGSAPARTMEYDEFMAAFGVLGQDPVAVAFGKSFAADPELAEVWRAFKADKEVENLADDLKGSPAFRKLVAQEKKAPAFKEFAKRALALMPGLSEVLRASGAGSLTGVRDTDAPGDRMLLADGGPATLKESKEGRRAAVNRFVRGPGPRVSAGTQGRSRVAGSQGTSGQAGKIEGVGYSGSAADGAVWSAPSADGSGNASAAPTAALARASSGAGGHEVKAKLGPISVATSDPMKRLLELFPWLAALSEDERRSLLPLIDTHGLWGACFALGMYQRCQTACAGTGGSCVPSTGWQACLDFKENSQAACIPLCTQQPGCTAPAAPAAGGAAAGGPAEGDQNSDDDVFNGTEWRTGADGKERKAGNYDFKNWEEADKAGFKPPDE